MKELPQGIGVGGVEGRGPVRANFGRSFLEPVAVAAGDYDIGTLRTGTSSCLKPNARTPADDNDSLSKQLWFA
jgi:hypothetical protein